MTSFFAFMSLNPPAFLSIAEYMIQIGKKKDRHKNRVYGRKNIDINSKLQIWLMLGLELVENKRIWKWWKMTQTTTKYLKYDDNMQEKKSSETSFEN